MKSQVTITGNVGGDVVKRATQTGYTVANFRMASTPRRNKDGVWVDAKTTWVDVTCWGQLGENVSRSLRRGDPVVVAGELSPDVWVDQAGVRHERLVLVAESVGHDLSRGSSQFERQPRQTFEASVEESSATQVEVVDTVAA